MTHLSKPLMCANEQAPIPLVSSFPWLWAKALGSAEACKNYCVSPTAPPALGEAELIRKEGFAGWTLAKAAQILHPNATTKNELRELHGHFAQRRPRPRARTCAQLTQPRLLEQRSRPTPIRSRPACCLRQGAPWVPVDRRCTLVALWSMYLVCVSFGD